MKQSDEQALRQRFKEWYLDFNGNFSRIPNSVETFNWFLPHLKSTSKEVSESEKIVIACKDELLKHLFHMTHENGYPIKGVPQATILELPALMKQALRDMQSNSLRDNDTLADKSETKTEGKEAVAFAEWIWENAGLEHTPGVWFDTDNKTYTTRDLYEKFKEDKVDNNG